MNESQVISQIQSAANERLPILRTLHGNDDTLCSLLCPDEFKSWNLSIKRQRYGVASHRICICFKTTNLHSASYAQI